MLGTWNKKLKLKMAGSSKDSINDVYRCQEFVVLTGSVDAEQRDKEKDVT
jgi:hypothetical protein